MTNDILLNRFRERGLLPFQADFAIRVLTEGAPYHLVLEGPVGSGMTHTISYAVGEGVQSGVFRRVLYLTAGAGLAYAMRERIRESVVDVPVECVDRKVLWGYEAVAPEDAEIWPERGVFVATLDFAKRPEVSSLFTSATWDVVVIDEAQRVVKPSARQEFVRSLITGSVSRVVSVYRASTAKVEHVLSQLDRSRKLSKTVWTSEDLRNWDGKPLTQNAVEWRIVRYHMNEREAAFYETLEETAHAVDRLVRGNSLVQQSLMNRAMSCLYSVERALMDQRSRLRQRRNELAHGVGIRPHQRTLFEIEDEEDQLSLFEVGPDQAAELLSSYEQVMKLLDDALKQFEDLETDSKSQAAIEVIRNLAERNVCVLSQFQATVSYLHTVFAEEEGMHPITVGGHLPGDEVERLLSEYQAHGGLLLASDAGLRGFEYPDADVVLHYDLPMSPERLHFRITRFNRIGRQDIVRMIGLVEENAVTGRLWDKVLSVAADVGVKGAE